MIRKVASSSRFLLLSPIFSLIGLGSFILLPRLLSPHFGLFDDPRSLSTARQILQGIWSVNFDVDAGRFRPVYWLYLTLLYLLAGEKALGWYLGNLMLLVAACLLLWQWLRQRSGSNRLGMLAAVLFVLSGPVIENYYTLSKGEPLQVVCILGALVVLSRLPERFDGRTLLLGSLLFWLANATKETTLTMIPITVGWALLSWLRMRHFQITREGHLVLAASLAGAVFFLARSLALSGPLTSGTYTNGYAITLSAIRASLIRWAGWLMRDFFYLLPVSIFLGYRLITKRPPLHTPLALEALVWMAAWMVVFLPWVYMVEYYMLPFAIGAAIFGAVGLEAMLEDLLVPHAANYWSIISFSSTLLLLLSALPNNLSNACIQLAVDEANAHTLHTLAETLPTGAHLRINIQEPNEYYEQLNTYLTQLNGRTDLEIAPVQPGQIDETPFYVALPFIENQPRLSVRLGVDEPTQRAWNRSLLAVIQTRETQRIAHQERSFRLFNLNLPRLLCFALPAQNYCTQPEPLFDLRRFVYGWDVYLVTSDHR